MDALGVAGGDGSLAVVAAAALAHDLPFVCVPAGTRNHFALDVGVDRSDLVGSLDAFTDGVERRIDVAEVNGRLFLNNVSLGIYGDAVREPTYRDAKARTLAGDGRAGARTERAAVDLQLVDDLGHAHRDPVVVLVSNNPYALEPAACTRHAAERSTAGSSGSSCSTRPRAGQTSGRAWTATRLEATAPAVVHAGVDGEAVDLTPPLRFIIRHDDASSEGPVEPRRSLGSVRRSLP